MEMGSGFRLRGWLGQQPINWSDFKGSSLASVWSFLISPHYTVSVYRAKAPSYSVQTHV
jgi:hypothetical protein